MEEYSPSSVLLKGLDSATKSAAEGLSLPWGKSAAMRRWMKLILALILVLPNLYSLKLLAELKKYNDVVALLNNSAPLKFQTTGSFLAEGVLVSSGGKSLKSLQQRRECLGFRTQVHRVYKDAEGEEVSTRVFDERRSVVDLRVRFKEGSVSLADTDIDHFFGINTERLDACPHFVPSAAVSEPDRGGPPWYIVREDLWLNGQKMFVAGQLDQGGKLGPHSVLKQLVCYPGGRIDAAAAFNDKSLLLGMTALFATLLSLLLAGALRWVFLTALGLNARTKAPQDAPDESGMPISSDLDGYLLEPGFLAIVDQGPSALRRCAAGHLYPKNILSSLTSVPFFGALYLTAAGLSGSLVSNVALGTVAFLSLIIVANVGGTVYEWLRDRRYRDQGHLLKGTVSKAWVVEHDGYNYISVDADFLDHNGVHRSCSGRSFRDCKNVPPPGTTLWVLYVCPKEMMVL